MNGVQTYIPSENLKQFLLLLRAVCERDGGSIKALLAKQNNYKTLKVIK